MTKREAIRQVPAADLKLVAEAAIERTMSRPKGDKEARRIRKAAKVLAQVQAGRERQ